MKELMIDNAGYDVQAMSKMSQQEFVDTHFDNDAIGRGRDADGRRAYLAECHSKIVEASKEPVEETKTAKPEKKSKEKPAPAAGATPAPAV
jgi:hypothetical protein